MANKKNRTGLNFRPNMSDHSLKPEGKTPASEPHSVIEIFTLIVLFLCKKCIFCNTSLRVLVYLGASFFISLLSDYSTVPKSYLSRSDNVFNKYFVKFAWGWNLTLLIPYLILTTYIYCCGQKLRIFRHHFTRILIATFFWWSWTNFFNVIEASYGRCAVKTFGSKETCLHAGHIWNGFDISGHSFILIYGTLFLIEETRSITNWENIKEHLRLEGHDRSIGGNKFSSNPLKSLSDAEFKDLQINYKKFTPYIRALFITITLFQILWDVMLMCTLLYYHVMVEKVLGTFAAVVTWFLTYRAWYTYPNIVPKLPGEGVFKYIKPKQVQRESFPAARRRTGSIVNGSGGPTFMGRRIYGQSPVRDESTS